MIYLKIKYEKVRVCSIEIVAKNNAREGKGKYLQTENLEKSSDKLSSCLINFVVNNIYTYIYTYIYFFSFF